MHSLDNSFSTEGLKEEDHTKRAEFVLLNATKIGVPELLRAQDIVTGNTKLNTIFIAELFNTRHGMEELTKEEYEAASMVDDDIEGSRDERAFRLWINSLGIEDLYVTNLYDEASDGLILLKVIHKLDNTVVDWKKVEKNPNNRFKKGINCT